MRVNFIGIGAQKCASTWVHRILTDHPDATIYPDKESDFFSTFYARGYQWYENQVGVTGTTKVAGEISPSYFADSDTPFRVYQYNPDMRIILSLRDPIERAYSNHLHVVRLGYFAGPNLDFEAGLQNNPMYLENSRYAKHLARWLEFFSPDQILVIFQEDIVSDPLEQAQNLYRFLNIAGDHQSWFLEKKVNESVITKHAGMDSVLKRLGKIGRAVGIGGVVETVKKNNWVRRLRRDHNQVELRQVIPPMRDETRENLLDILADDMRELARLLERDSLPWKSWQKLCQK